MARIVAFVPDLLFGSNVHATLSAAGHDVELVAELRPDLHADALVVDLTADVAARIELARPLMARGIRALAFYSHVEADVRALADQAGFELVVPRSRMAREAPALLAKLESNIA